MRNTNFFEYHGSNWDTKKVKDVAAVNEENISSSDIYDEIEYIEISTVNKGEISDIPIINFDEAPSRAKRKVKQNDILISTVRPNLEHYTFIKSANSNTIASTGFAVITAKEIEPRFLYYVLTSQKYTDYFSMIAEGHTSAYPAMNPDVIENVQVPVPPKEEQKRIAHILGTLDDKIELNQRMNETLEAIARAIFKSWFVDFDPVRAKMAGEPYPLPDAVMALFPDELVESELGMIPKGWEVTKIKNFIKIKNKSIDPLQYPNNQFNYYSIPSYDKNKIPSNELGKNIKSRKYKITEDSLLFSRLNPSTPRIWLPFNFGTNSICSTEFLVISPKIYIDKYFLYYLFSSTRFINITKGLVTGTSSSHQRVKPKDFQNIECLIPDKDVIIKFSEFTKAILVAINHNFITNENVKVSRDRLINFFFSK